MTRLQLDVAEDGLTATVRVAAGPAATADDLADELRRARVTYGVDAEAAAALAARLADERWSGDVVVARGEAPRAGRDGALQGEGLLPPQVGARRAGDRVDYRERHLLHPVAEGDVAARVLAPTAGAPGRDVRGRELPAAPGAPFAQRVGDGLRRDGDRLFARTSGVVLATDELVDVVALYTHEGDVGYASGNLHAGGSLHVTGDVGDGFEATAEGDVVVGGSVQGGVTARGSVAVDRAVLGDALAVRAGCDIRCRIATSARLVAGRTIFVQEQAAQSALQAPDVFVVDGRGSVRGGSVTARGTIEVRDAGSPGGAPTTLATAQLLDERRELARRSTTRAREQRQAARTGLAKDGRAAVRAGDRERDELVRLRRRQRELMRAATVRVTASCHEGVTVRIGYCERRVEETMRAVAFVYDDTRNTIVTEELR